VVSGDNQAAYLYDISDMPAFDPVYLGSGVLDVQFQADDMGQLTGITTVLDDGVCYLYDPSGKPTGQIAFSPDRTRKVDISGDDREAYLYDTSDPPAFEPVYLGAWVAGVQFQADDQGQLVIMVLNEDGSVNSYDSSGKLIDSQPAPQADSGPKAYNSTDGTRQVLVSGDNKDAYLYDTTDSPTFDPVYLGSGVTDVLFQADDQGKILFIMTLSSDGGFTLFDQNGNPQNVVPAPAPVDPVPAPADGQGDGGNTTSAIGKSLQNSAIFKALKSGLSW